MPVALLLTGGLQDKGSSTKGMNLTDVLNAFQDSLDFARTFTGKGGGRRNGCMINCSQADAAAGAVEAFLAGQLVAPRVDMDHA